MGLTINKPGEEPREVSLDPRERIRAELAALRAKREEQAPDRELQELQEELEYERACAAARPHERIGRAALEPGQIIFRQMSRAHFKLIAEADIPLPGKPPMTEAQAADARRMASERVYRECLISPAWDTFQEWLISYPLAMGAYGDALNEHNDAHRKAVAAK